MDDDMQEKIRDLSSKEHGCIGDISWHIATWSPEHIEKDDIIGIEFPDGGIQKCLVLSVQPLPNGATELILGL